MTRRKLDVNDIWHLEQGHRVIVPFNEETSQPKCQGGDLFNKFLSKLSKRFLEFPIDAKNWHEVSMENKKALWNEIVKVIF